MAAAYTGASEALGHSWACFGDERSSCQTCDGGYASAHHYRVVALSPPVPHGTPALESTRRG